jgi:hypothetical protein
VAGSWFPVGGNPLRFVSPYYLLAKHDLLAACFAPHRAFQSQLFHRRRASDGSYDSTAHLPPEMEGGITDCLIVHSFPPDTFLAHSNVHEGVLEWVTAFRRPLTLVSCLNFGDGALRSQMDTAVERHDLSDRSLA